MALLSLYIVGAYLSRFLETELFGFAGDKTTVSSEGCLRKADGGTLVLDEVSKMPPIVQEKISCLFKNGRGFTPWDHLAPSLCKCVFY